ncbi:hypothetical protein A5724_11620 [Mycobacterium sp. ACS1612]|nr:hypothetical protein A5724_11620 [Mycobacterium sp. ACS1612]
MGPCDIAQAALFADILSAEIVTLRAQLRRAEKQWDHRRDRSRGEVETPARLIRLREQLNEARRLAARLRKLPTHTV